MRIPYLPTGPGAIALGACALLLTAAPATAQQAQPRAATGDTVSVLLNHVKADQRANFERFVFEILFPAIDKLGATDPARRRQYVQTRVLVPTRANADSTYTYIYIMDPRVSGVSYGYRNILSQVYTEQQVTEHLALVTNALARPQVGFTVVQRH